MAGLFKKLYDLRLNSEKHQTEDYLTEIFAHCLRQDATLLKAFLKEFDILPKATIKDYKIETQKTYSKLNCHDSDSRPDIVISNDNTVIFFENKINSPEGFEQLKRYAEQLDNLQETNKSLVYITKHYDPKSKVEIFKCCNNTIKFREIRWYEIFNFLKKQQSLLEKRPSSEIVKELIIYMKQTNLSMNIKFEETDIPTLKNFSNIMKMMDETINVATKDIKKNHNSVLNFSLKKNKFFNNSRYAYESSAKHGLVVSVGYWFIEDDYPNVQIEIALYHKDFKDEEKLKMIDEQLRSKQELSGDSKWEYYSKSDGWSGLFTQKSLQDFLSGADHLKNIQEYFLNDLEKVEKILESVENILKSVSEVADSEISK